MIDNSCLVDRLTDRHRVVSWSFFFVIITAAAVVVVVVVVIIIAVGGGGGGGGGAVAAVASAGGAGGGFMLFRHRSRLHLKLDTRIYPKVFSYNSATTRKISGPYGRKKCQHTWCRLIDRTVTKSRKPTLLFPPERKNKGKGTRNTRASQAKARKAVHLAVSGLRSSCHARIPGPLSCCHQRHLAEITAPQTTSVVLETLPDPPGCFPLSSHKFS